MGDKTFGDETADQLRVEERIERKYPLLNVQVTANTHNWAELVITDDGDGSALAEMLGNFYENPLMGVSKIQPHEDGGVILEIHQHPIETDNE